MRIRVDLRVSVRLRDKGGGERGRKVFAVGNGHGFLQELGGGSRDGKGCSGPLLERLGKQETKGESNMAAEREHQPRDL